MGGAVGWAAASAKLAAREPIAPVNVQDGVAAKGYDVVAYFTDGKPVPGSPAHAYKWQGVTYRFASDGHRDAFKRQPEKYAPQYGGYCAFAMSSGRFSPGAPNRWRIEGGKLYLNANIFAQSLWEADIPKRVIDADGHWPAKQSELEKRP